MELNITEEKELKERQMKTIIANPPFSAQWSCDPKYLNDVRFSEYGKLAPKSKADFAFLQDMIYKLEETGLMAVVLPHGVLFRGAAEGKIRQFLIEKKNYIDAIIGLPANIFYGTGIPTCIIVAKKCRKEDEGVLFIDASREFEKQKNKNQLTEENIQKISNTYLNRTEIEMYSREVSIREIIENECNLNIPRYIDTFEKEPEIDIYEVLNEIKSLESQRYELDKEINNYMKELGIIM